MLALVRISDAQIIDVERRVNVRGQVVNVENNEPVSFVLVYNSASNTGASSDSLGRFQLPMQQGDSIIFSSLGFDKLLYIAQANDLSKKVDLMVALNIRTYELSGVDVFAFKSEEDFKKHILSMDIPEEEKPIEIPGVTYSRAAFPPGEGGIAFSGPISGLYDKYSRRGKSHAKYREAKRAYEVKELVANKLNSEVVQEITGLEGEELEAFLNFCKLSDAFVTNANDYELIVAVHDCFKEYKQKKG